MIDRNNYTPFKSVNIAESKQITVEVDRSDLIYIDRLLESAYAIIEAVSKEGDEDDSLMLELDEVSALVKSYLHRKG